MSITKSRNNFDPLDMITIKTIELTRTSQSWDGVQLPDFPEGKPVLTIQHPEI